MKALHNTKNDDVIDKTDDDGETLLIVNNMSKNIEAMSAKGL